MIVVTVAAGLQPIRTFPEKTGVIVEAVGEGALDDAGLRPGDRVYAWRASAPGVGEYEGAEGIISSAFDWSWLEAEQAPIGLVELLVHRAGRDIVLQVFPGRWDAAVRPHWPVDVTRLYEKGKDLIEEGQVEAGVARWNEAMASVGSLTLRDSKAWFLLRIGHAWREAERWDEALAVHHLALDSTSSVLAQAETWSSMGEVHHGQSNIFKSAIVASWLRSHNERSSTDRHANYFSRMRAEPSIERLMQLPLRTKDILPWEAASQLAPIQYSSALSLAADAIQQIGQGRATECFEKAAVLLASRGRSTLGAATVQNRLARLAFERGESDRAVELYQVAEANLSQMAPGSLLQAQSLSGLSLMNRMLGDDLMAETYRQRYLPIQGRRGAPSDRRMALSRLSHSAYQKSRWAEAARFNLRDFELRQESLPTLDPEALQQRHVPLTIAASLFDLNLFKVVDSRTRNSLRHEFSDLRYELIRSFLGLGQVEEAFMLVEESRGSEFLRQLSVRRDRRTRASEELEDRRRNLDQHYDQVQSELAVRAPGVRDAEIVDLVQRLQQLRQDRDVLDSETLQDEYYGRISSREIMQTLDVGTLMLSYVVAEKETYVFSLSRDHAKVQVHTLPIGRAILGRQVDAWVTQVAEADRGDVTGARLQAQKLGEALYRILIEPIEGLVEASERVVIVPDGPLHHVPWAALVRPLPMHPTDPRRDWHYFSEWKPTHAVLSATIYKTWHRTRWSQAGRRGRALQWVGFGDPVYRNVGRTAAQRGRSSADRRLFVGWEPIPHSRTEVEAIASLFPASSTRVVLGDSVTEEEVELLGRRGRILHLATHTYLSETSPLDSGVVLTVPDARIAGRHNGVLQAWEIIDRLRLNADLVVLASCGSATGREHAGEGLQSLARAFHLAGARSVVASLWPVDDRATAALMVRFYRHLRSGLTKDEALRQAQIELIRGPITIEEEGEERAWDFSSPYYWAAFQVYGDWQ